MVLRGFVLESFRFIALALTLAALRTNAALVLTLLLLSAGYALSGIADLTNSVEKGEFGAIGNIGGWVLVASAFFACISARTSGCKSGWSREVTGKELPIAKAASFAAQARGDAFQALRRR